MDFTTTALLASIRRRAAVPAATATGSADADLLALANEELQFWLVPLVMGLREEYFLHRSSVTLEEGVAEYRIPSRAVGAKLREIEIVTASGQVRNLYRIGPDEGETETTGSGQPTAFYLRSSSVVLSPTPSTAETLRFTYFIRPNELVAVSAVESISTINTVTGAVLCASTIPVAFTTSVRYDLIAGTSGFEHLAIGLTATAATGSTVTFTAADLPSGLAVGDYVCLAEQSPVPQAPADFHPLLAQRVAMKLLEMTGQTQKHEVAARRLREMEEGLRVTFAPRVDGEPKIIPPNAHGLMGHVYSLED